MARSVVSVGDWPPIRSSVAAAVAATGSGLISRCRSDGCTAGRILCSDNPHRAPVRCVPQRSNPRPASLSVSGVDDDRPTVVPLLPSSGRHAERLRRGAAPKGHPSGPRKEGFLDPEELLHLDVIVQLFTNAGMHAASLRTLHIIK
jgi:hypothetical protein